MSGPGNQRPQPSRAEQAENRAGIDHRADADQNQQHDLVVKPDAAQLRCSIFGGEPEHGRKDEAGDRELHERLAQGPIDFEKACPDRKAAK